MIDQRNDTRNGVFNFGVSDERIKDISERYEFFCDEESKKEDEVGIEVGFGEVMGCEEAEER